jgi:hypothetical protein
MEIVTLTDALDDISNLRRLVGVRDSLHSQRTDGLSLLLSRVGSAQEDFSLISPIDDPVGARLAITGLATSTETLMGFQDAMAQLSAVDRRVEVARDAGIRGMRYLIDYGAAVPEAFTPDEFAGTMLELSEGNFDVEDLTNRMVGPRRNLDVEHYRSTLRRLNGLRIRSLLAGVLAELAGIQSAPEGISKSDVEDTLTIVLAMTTELRDAAIAAAKSINDRMTPIIPLSLWSSLHRFEAWLLSDGTSLIAQGIAFAFHRAQSELAPNVSVMRTSGRVFDAFARGLAFDSGIRATLVDYALQIEQGLSDFAGMASLQVGAATLDLPRSSLASVASADEGDVVEIDGVIESAEYVVGGPAPRSVLVVGTGSGTRVNALVPFSAVDSFGVVPGVWVQLRGTAFPNGKDDLPGPALRVRRIQRAEAMNQSASDRLIWLGRELYSYRPGGYDIMATRPAGVPEALAEIELRQGVD